MDKNVILNQINISMCVLKMFMKIFRHKDDTNIMNSQNHKFKNKYIKLYIEARNLRKCCNISKAQCNL